MMSAPEPENPDPKQVELAKKLVESAQEYRRAAKREEKEFWYTVWITILFILAGVFAWISFDGVRGVQH